MQPGIDTSKWSGVINWKLVLESGLVKFNFGKATEGTSGVDSNWVPTKSGCAEVGIPLGAYHFFRPAYDSILQANHFVNIVGSGIKAYVCDVETTVLSQASEILLGNSPSTTALSDTEGPISPILGGRDYYTEEELEAIQAAVSRAEMTSRITTAASGSATSISLAEKVKIFMERVYQLTGIEGIIYTSPAFWNYNVAPWWTWDMPYDLWVAHWGVSQPTIPNKWTSWVFWQYTTTLQIPGIPSYEDGNWAKDSLNLYTYFGNGSPTPPPPPPDVDLVRITASALYMRKEPYGAIKGTLVNGNILKVTQVVQDPYDSTKFWYYSGPNACFAGWWTEPV